MSTRADIMARTAIVEYFASTRVLELPSFRALCNALKALAIAAAVQALREKRKGRMSVLDLGCGKGGDVGKWMAHRPKQLRGLDGSASCIAEAVERHRALVSNGRGSMAAQFNVVDLCAEAGTFPQEDASVDIVASHFFLQFTARNETCLRHVLGECVRMLAPGGVLLCLVPDGDRILSLLRGQENCRFGHFHLRKCRDVSYAPDACPYGLAYCFSLGEDGCTEFVLLPALLDMHLRNLGMEGVFDGEFSLSAQDFFLAQREHENIVQGITKGQMASHTDWLTLGMFRVFLARRPLKEPTEQ